MSPAVLELAEAFRLRIIEANRGPMWRPDSPLDHVVQRMLDEQEKKGPAAFAKAQFLLSHEIPHTGEYSSNFLKRMEILLNREETK